jgi:flagellar export protein FliJ
MAFRFSLATLLKLREIAEQREERLLGQIQSQIVQARQSLVDLATQREGLFRRREEALQQSTSAVELLNSYEQVRVVERHEENGRAQLEKLETLRVQQMKIYQDAHRKAEVLTEMRGDQKELFYKELTKKEQSVMDDNFSSRRAFK